MDERDTTGKWKNNGLRLLRGPGHVHQLTAPLDLQDDRIAWFLGWVAGFAAKGRTVTSTRLCDSRASLPTRQRWLGSVPLRAKCADRRSLRLLESRPTAGWDSGELLNPPEIALFAEFLRCFSDPVRILPPLAARERRSSWRNESSKWSSAG
jgi:hypothetical protein